MVLLAVLVYVAIGVSSAALIIRSAMSSSRPRHPATTQIQHVYEAAFLSGGPARVADSALAALHADGRVVIGGPGIVSVRHALAHDPVERAVFEQLATAPTGALHTLRRAVMRHPAVQEVGDALAASGLMTPPGQNRALTVWGLTQGILSLVAFPAAFALTIISFVDDAVGDTDGFAPPFIVMVFPALIAGVVIGFVMANRSKRRITPAGRDALRSYGVQHAQVFSPAHLVAVHGLRGVPDPALQAQLITAARMPTAGTSHSSSSSYTDSAAVWCAGSSPGSGCGSSSCGGSSGSSCGGSSGSSCSSGSSGSSCGGSSGSSCSSSSGSSCGGGSSS
ncbi:TIGR04222 domain-containing membrane protein [Streptomyces sp. CA-135486]|uniref:TIGR04222 domain-containing membrane protein n=1 Tax=Streptomyces sp. CA-135486 TaxID=3240049 RepID=UPI003D94C607